MFTQEQVNAAISELKNQIDWLSQRNVNLAVEIANLKKELVEEQGKAKKVNMEVVKDQNDDVAE
jgi:cell division protein FtsB